MERTTWSARTALGSLLLLASTASGQVINEVLANADLPFEQAIELFNPTPNPVDISSWWLSDSTNAPMKFRVPSGTVLPPFGFKVFYEYSGQNGGFNPNGQGTGSSFALNEGWGGQVYLFSANNDAQGTITGLRAALDYGPSENGASLGRYVTSVGVDFTALSARTFGADNPGTVQQFRTGTGLPNAYPKVGPVVISEVMYHPPDFGTNDNVRDEFIELENIFPFSIPLYDPANPTNTWRLRDAVSFLFPINTALAPGQRLLVVSFDPNTNAAAAAAFRANYGLSGFIPLFGPYSGHLDNSLGNVELIRSGAPIQFGPDAGLVPQLLVDKVAYASGPPWPVGANAGGASLQRWASSNYGNDPANWIGQGRSPAAPTIIVSNYPPVLTSIADQSIHAGAPFSLSVTATDPDVPPNRLRFSLIGAVPDGAAIHPQTGVFTWTPAEISSGNSFSITIRVIDDGTPPMAATQTFLVTVISPINLRIERQQDVITLTWNSIPGQVYFLEATADLTAPVWPVQTVVNATNWTMHWREVINSAAEAWCYRVMVGWRETCLLSKEWRFISSTINVWPQGKYRKLPCEPLALRAYAVDRHALTYKCGCDESLTQKNVPMRAKVEYAWSIERGGGRFVRVTGGSGGSFESVQQVLYQPPDLLLNQEITVVLLVKAHHNDTGKPPFHGPSTATITMKIRREITADTQTVGDIQIEQEKDEYVYDITVDPSNVLGSPLPGEAPIGECLPSHEWLQVSPIAGEIVAQNQYLYTDDSVVLLAFMASDADKLKLKCTQAGRCVSTEVELPLRDVLDFEWSCDKGSFPVGNIGDSVVWRAPDSDGDVTITLTNRNVGGQYDDDVRIVKMTLHVQKVERKAQVAAVAWIDANDPAIANLPQPPDNPPAANADPTVPWIAPDYLGSTYGYSYYEHPVLLDGRKWQQLRLLPIYERLGSLHPWYHACVGLKDSANPQPPASFDGVPGLRAWMQNKEYRSALALKMKARVRRGHIVTADLEDYALDVGWTPMRGYPNIVERFFIGILAPELAELLASIQANPFEPGERKNAKITISSLCKDRVTFRMTQSFRLGATGNRINKAMTNRDAPWITPVIEMTLYADRDPQQSDFSHTADPQFPSWDLYYGDPTLNRFTTKAPGERQIEFINRGPKINPRGL